MKKTLLTFIVAISFFISAAQLHPNSIQLTAARSWHGTGDFSGLAIDIAYDYHFSKRIDFSNGITTTIHYGKFDPAFYLSPGIFSDKNAMRFTTGGVQLTSMIHAALLAKPDYRLKLGVGPIFRFQSTSYPAVFGLINDPNVYPEPFYTISNFGTDNTYSIGYTVGLTLLLRVAAQYEAGGKISFQNDTNGDAITQIGIVLGRFLR